MMDCTKGLIAHLGQNLKQQKNILLILAFYLAVVIAGALHHEMFRDEVRALSIATQSESLPDLFKRLHNEGHPALWYVLLHISYLLFQTPRVLPVLTLLIATTAVYVFLLKAPFPNWQKALFAFGLFPIFQYSIICRSYGMSMLLLFVVAALYPHRDHKMIWVGIVLFLLAQTNLPSLIITITILASLLYEHLSRPTTAVNHPDWTGLAGMGIILAGIVISIAQIVPDTNSTVYDPGALNISGLSHALINVVLNPGHYFHQAFHAPVIVASLVLWFFWIFFLKELNLWIILWGSAVGMGMSFEVIYPGIVWHQGVYFILWICMIWLHRIQSARQNSRAIHASIGNGRKIVRIAGEVLFVGVLLLEFLGAAKYYRRDWFEELSSSKSLGTYLASHQEYKEAIIIGEPDYLLESLPYYAKNAIYIPRENHFGKTVSFTKASKDTLSLDDLLRTAEVVQNREHHPVLIALGHSLNNDGPWVIKLGHRIFVHSSTSWHNFLAKTELVQTFKQAMGDENYTLYRLR
jgi:hypothetical protein